MQIRKTIHFDLNPQRNTRARLENTAGADLKVMQTCREQRSPKKNPGQHIQIDPGSVQEEETVLWHPNQFHRLQIYRDARLVLTAHYPPSSKVTLMSQHLETSVP